MTPSTLKRVLRRADANPLCFGAMIGGGWMTLAAFNNVAAMANPRKA